MSQRISVGRLPTLKTTVSDIYQPSKLKCRTNYIRSFNNPLCRTKYGSPATWPTGKTPSHGSQRNLIFSIRRPSGITLGGLKIPNVKLIFSLFLRILAKSSQITDRSIFKSSKAKAMTLVVEDFKKEDLIKEHG